VLRDRQQWRGTGPNRTPLTVGVKSFGGGYENEVPRVQAVQTKDLENATMLKGGELVKENHNLNSQVEEGNWPTFRDVERQISVA